MHSDVRPIRILPAGSHALLVAPDDHTGVDALASTLRRNELPGVTDVLPAAQTVLVTAAPSTDLRALEESIRGLAAGRHQVEPDDDGDEPEPIRVPVSYTGSDLGDVAALLGISVDDVVAEHTRRIWRCAFVGFAPGFGYLVSSEPGLSVPRRTESRTAVPPGAVALADGYSAVYPRRSPGGWQIIGTTDIPTWDLDQAQPALIRPGCRVQFVAEAIR